MACLRGTSDAPQLQLTGFRQSGERNVYLNEPLVFDFSEELDPASITESRDGTSGSVRVLDPNGSVVAGTLSVNSRQIVFTPRLALQPNLSDGGFRPGTEYRVEFVGFPRPDGVRSKRAVSLERSQRLGFRTALLGGPKPLFDPFLELGGGPARMALGERGVALQDPLSISELRINPGQPISIVSTYAIDPGSLSSSEFTLTNWDQLEGQRGAGAIVLHARLVENHGLTETSGRGYLARIELVPERALPLGRYVLTRVQGKLRTLAGQTLQMYAPFQGIVIHVAPPDLGRQSIAFPPTLWGRHDEAWGSDGSLISAAKDSGVASGSETGATLRLLAAAGDGQHGELFEPGDFGEGSELQATRMSLAAESTLDLSSRTGCVVLRAQGAVDLDGALIRDLAPEVRWSDPMPFSRTPGREEQLSAWILRMQALGEPWTVIVAGGDLRVRGEIRVQGPLLLVAGGAIRVYEGGRVRGQVIYKSSAGGNNIGQVRDAPLELDPPLTNPLVVPLVYGLLTRPFRPQGGVRRWLKAEVQGDLKSTQLELQFVGLRDLPGGDVAEVGPVASLEQLGDCQGIRLLVLLTAQSAEMEASAGQEAGPWQAPLIQSVTLSWEPKR